MFILLATSSCKCWWQKGNSTSGVAVSEKPPVQVIFAIRPLHGERKTSTRCKDKDWYASAAVREEFMQQKHTAHDHHTTDQIRMRAQVIYIYI